MTRHGMACSLGTMYILVCMTARQNGWGSTLNPGSFLICVCRRRSSLVLLVLANAKCKCWAFQKDACVVCKGRKGTGVH